MWLLALKVAIALVAFTFHVKAGALVLIVVISDAVIDYFMTRAIARQAHKEIANEAHAETAD